MNESLEARIRRHVEQVDGSVPRVEDLVQAAVRDAFEGRDEQPATNRLVIEVPVHRSRHRTDGRRRVASVVLAAAAALALFVAGAAILRDGDGGTVVTDTPLTTTDISTPPGDSAAPVVSPAPGDDGPQLAYDHTEHVLTGTGWAPDAFVAATQGDLAGTATTTRAGSFEIRDVFGHCCAFGAPLVVTDGTNTSEVVLPLIEIARVDHVNDIIAGRVDDVVDGTLRLTVTVASNEHFETVVDITEDGWSTDLSGRFDLLNGMTVTATVERDGITSRTRSVTGGSATLDLAAGDSSILRGGGWHPGRVVTIEIGGRTIGAGTVTNVSGGFEITLDPIDAGSEVRVTDGESDVAFEVPLLTYDSFDTDTRVGSGRAGLPDGTTFEVELWMGPTADGEPTARHVAEGSVNGGEWNVTFDPLPPGLVALLTDVTYQADDGSWVYQPQLRLG